MDYSENKSLRKKNLRIRNVVMSRIKVKFKVCAYCENSKPIFRNIPHKGPQCEDCYRREKALSKNKKAKQSRRFETVFGKDLPDLIKAADKKFSIAVRLRGTEEGVCRCYTCSTPMSFNEAQCGHYVSRSELSTRWMLENCRPQCNTCNVLKSGNLEVFKQKLDEESPGMTEQLQMLSKQVYKPTKDDLLEIIKSFSQLAKQFS